MQEICAMVNENLEVGAANMWVVSGHRPRIIGANEAGIASIAFNWNPSKKDSLLDTHSDLQFESIQCLQEFFIPEGSPLSEGSVQELATALLGVDVHGGPSRFATCTWFPVGETVASCPQCDVPLYGFRSLTRLRGNTIIRRSLRTVRTVSNLLIWAKKENRLFISPRYIVHAADYRVASAF